MEIEGTYTLQAPAEDVWRCLMDQQTIQHTIPGLERLTQTDEQNYTFALHIRYAPLRGNYTGRACILEQRYPVAYRLQIEGEGPTSRFHSTCDIQLLLHNANTVLSYHATLELGRNSKLLSTALVKGALKVLLHQFFTVLADQLRSAREEPIYVTTLEEIYDIPFMEEQLSENLLTARQPQTPATALHRLVRRLGLSQHNPQKEEQWVSRLRQFGMVAALLLLVWIGTRLPRRPIRS